MSLLLNYESAVINTTGNKKASLPLTARSGMGYGLPHCWQQQQQHRPQKSIWPQAAAQATDIRVSSGGNTDQEHQHLSGCSTDHENYTPPPPRGSTNRMVSVVCVASGGHVAVHSPAATGDLAGLCGLFLSPEVLLMSLTNSTP